MITLAVKSALCIVGIMMMLRTSDCGIWPFYKLPFYTLIYCGGHAIAIGTIVWMLWPIISMVKTNNSTNMGVANILVGCLMAFVWLIEYSFGSMENVSPFGKLCDNYKMFCKNGPRISFSVFKKMVSLHPENFEFSALVFKYSGEKFSLSLPGYLWALCLCMREADKKESRKCNNEQRRIYDKMQRDLDTDLDRINRERDRALADINKAAHNTQDILARISNERR